jgi:hypothetical protein
MLPREVVEETLEKILSISGGQQICTDTVP